jgi:selenocysteine lyase/cysteine desulfurase
MTKHRPMPKSGGPPRPWTDKNLAISQPAPNSNATAAGPPAFGSPEMRALFNFSPGYTPLNHGSYGTFPRSVMEYRTRLLSDFESRPDIYKRFIYPGLLKKSRALVAPLLGANTDEVVFVPNATTGVNTVLRNIKFDEGDVILYPSSIYPACMKTIWSIQEKVKVETRQVDVRYPVEDEELVDAFRRAIEGVKMEGKTARLAIFDTIVSGPGVVVPWESLTALCKDQGVLSLIDGAHGIGHLDLTHVGDVSPDFLVTNCHK